jgi:hypothetical protein
MQTYFKDGTYIDSAYDKLMNGDTILYYTFKDDSSKVIFTLYDFNKGKRNFDVAYLQLKTNIFHFKNNIRIDMPRTEFFNTLNIKETDCDTFDINLDKKFSGRYYRFVFIDDRLQKISKEYVLE